MNNIATTRSEARLTGEKYFFTGRPCIREHISYRYTSTKNCVLCQKSKATLWCETNKKSHAFHMRRYMDIKGNDRYRFRYQNDIQFRLRCLLRSRCGKVISKNWKTGSAVDDLGCSVSEFKIYLERQFRDGMNWENQGAYWHIDHIKPLAAFDLSIREQFLEAAHYSNLQPLLVLENLSKGDNWNYCELKAVQ